MHGGAARIESATFANNSVQGTSDDNTPGGFGGGGAIYADADLIVARCTIDGNSADGGGGQPGAEAAGGGIASYRSLQLVESLIHRNWARRGFGIRGQFTDSPGGATLGGGVAAFGSAFITNCTIASNECRQAELVGLPSQTRPAPTNGPALGGGLYLQTANAQLSFLTIAGNALVRHPSNPRPAPLGAGLFAADDSAAALQGALLAHNLVRLQWSGEPPIPNTTNDLSGAIQDRGHNLVSDNSELTHPASLRQTNPLLGPLGRHGGPTATLPLLEGSPALNAAGTNSPATDQRGRARPFDSASDIGAYERGPFLQTNAFTWQVAPDGSVTLVFSSAEDGTYQIETSQNLEDWTVSHRAQLAAGQPLTIDVPATARHQFYRAKQDD